MNTDPPPEDSPGSRDFRPDRHLSLPGYLPVPRSATRASKPEIVYLDPSHDRPVSPYSPEGEIRMMGDFAAGLTRNRRVSRPLAYSLVAIIVLPILVSVIAVLLTWL